MAEPSSAANFPRSQSEQIGAPELDHLPRAQSVHAEALTFDQDPASQVMQELLAASACVPELQAMHAEAPLEEE